MFYYIKGRVTHKELNFLVIDVGGVGYKIYTSMNTLSQAEPEKELKVYTYTHIREDIFDIYGFSKEEELHTFQMLISVSGVGPKAALAILSFMPSQDFALAVIKGDVKKITGAPGIGKKIAERIILELKDKINKDLKDSGSSEMAYQGVSQSSVFEEAVNALMVLGYSALESKGAVSNVDKSCTNVEEIIKASLKQLMK